MASVEIEQEGNGETQSLVPEDENPPVASGANTEKWNKKKKMIIITIILITSILCVSVIGSSAVTLSLHSDIEHIKKTQGNNGNVKDESEKVEKRMEKGMVVVFDLTDGAIHHEKSGNDTEFIIEGFKKSRIHGISTIQLKDHGYFVVQRSDTYSITTQIAFVGHYRNCVIGIYIDDLLCDKGLSSAPLSKEGYMNVLSCEAKCLHVYLKEGQVITIRSFHDRNIYRSNKTSWVHFESHPGIF